MKKLISNKEYHAHPAIGSTLLKNIYNTTVAHAVTKEQKETAAMVLGSAIHAAILEPETFENLYVSEPDFSNSIDTIQDIKTILTENKVTFQKTAKKEILIETLLANLPHLANKIKSVMVEKWEKENQEKTILTDEIFKKIAEIKKALLSHEIAKALLTGGQSEFSYFSKDEHTGLQLKCRPDYFKSGALIDLKTTRNASSIEFSKQIANFNYHIQAAFYLDVFNAATSLIATEFYFVAVETEAPYGVSVYQLAPEEIEAGREDYKKALLSYKQYLEKSALLGKEKALTLSCYPEEISVIQRPYWAIERGAYE